MEKYHFVYYNLYSSFSVFSGEISSSAIVSYQNGAAHALFISSLHPFTFLASSFKVSFRKKQQHFIANNLFKEFLINDEVSNESEVKCRIFVWWYRSVIRDIQLLTMPFPVVIGSTLKSADLIVLYCITGTLFNSGMFCSNQRKYPLVCC